MSQAVQDAALAVSSDVSSVPSDNSSGGVAYEHNELLCFMQNKSMLMDFDSIVKLHMDFYSRDEVVAVLQPIEQYIIIIIIITNDKFILP